MGYSCQWILSAFGTNDHQHEEVSCIMTCKKRSSMVKETKGYKIVSLVWYIFCVHFVTHRVSNSYRLIRLSDLLFKWKWSFAQNSKWICWANCSKCIPLITFLFGAHPVLLASTCRHLLQYWIIWMRSGLYRPTGLLLANLFRISWFVSSVEWRIFFLYHVNINIDSNNYQCISLPKYFSLFYFYFHFSNNDGCSNVMMSPLWQ